MELCRQYLFVVLLFPLQWPVARSETNLTLDLAVIYVSQFGWEQIPKYKECTGVLAESFVLNESLTRIAVVARNGTIYGWKLFTPGLTSDAAELNASTKKMVVLPHTSEYSKMRTALKIVGEELKFAEPVLGRTRFIVMIIGQEEIEDRADDYAKMLREYGVGIYVLAQMAREEEMMKLTGSAENMYLGHTYNWIIDNLCPLFRRLTNITTSHACKYDDACFYTDQKTCANGSWTPGIPTDVFDCAANGYPFPNPDGGCQKENCSRTCNRAWPLEKEPSCTDETCGRNVNTSRTGPMRWKQLEHCPPYKQCPACPTSDRPTTEPPTTDHPSPDRPTSAPVLATTGVSSDFPGWAIALLVLGIPAIIGGAIGGVVFLKKKYSGKDKPAEKGTTSMNGSKKEPTEKGKTSMNGSKKEAAARSARDKIKSVTTTPVPAKGKGTK